MTAGQGTRRGVASNVSLAPIALAGLIGATMLTGGMLGAAITSQIASFTASQPAVGTGSDSADSKALVQFRAGERQGQTPASEKDAVVEFRAGEHGALTPVTQPDSLTRFRQLERERNAKSSTPAWDPQAFHLRPVAPASDGSDSGGPYNRLHRPE